MWGRRAAHDLAPVQALLRSDSKLASASEPEFIDLKRGESAAVVDMKHPLHEVENLVAIRQAFLTAYQNSAYAKQYKELVDAVAQAEQRATGTSRLIVAVARYYFKLMAYKDEYEVACLYTDGEFLKKVDQMFEGDWKLTLHLAPPLFAKRNAQGHLIKRAYGLDMLKVFSVLAKLKFLRGSALDIFGYTSERRTERELIREYRANILAVLLKLNRSDLDQAVALASLPEEIRGYGHIKEKSLTLAAGRRAALMDGFSAQVMPLKDSKAA